MNTPVYAQIEGDEMNVAVSIPQPDSVSMINLDMLYNNLTSTNVAIDAIEPAKIKFATDKDAEKASLQAQAEMIQTSITELRNMGKKTKAEIDAENQGE